MSYTEIIPFANGIPQAGVEFRNAWGGAARIWNALFNAHVPKKHEFDSWLHSGEGIRRLWDLAIRTDLPLSERAVLAFTFDLHYVRNEHFERLANDLRLFVEKYPAGNCVDHLPTWARWLGENNGVEAVGLYGTSVANNPWRRSKTCSRCGNTTDEMEPIPMGEGVEVYDWLDSLDVKS